MTETIQNLWTYLLEAELSIGFAQGKGLGAVLLALVAVTFLRKTKMSRLAAVVSAWRSKS